VIRLREYKLRLRVGGGEIERTVSEIGRYLGFRLGKVRLRIKLGFRVLKL